MKTCSRCGVEKVPDAFNRDAKSADGRRGICRDCSKKTDIARAEKRRLSFVQARGPRLVPPPPPVADDLPEIEIVVEEDPLTTAYRERDEKKEKADTRKQRDALLDENERLRAKLSEVIKLSQPPDVLVYRERKDLRADMVTCAIASDWHVEETVRKEAVHGLNEYSLEIARSRSEHFFRNLLRLTDIMARDSEVRTIYLAALGDFFSGHIHEELIASAALAPGDAARFVRDLWYAGIDFLLRESTYEIEGDMVPGNHGRMTKQVWFSDPTGTSLETFMYHAIAGRYEGNPRVRLKVADHAMIYRRFFEDFTIRAVHGYEVKFGGGVGGITIPIRKAIAQWDMGVRADLTLFGHFHQLFDGGTFLVNGSLIGFNEYAQAIKASFEEPRQAFFTIHARNGGTKSVTAPIWLDDAHQKEEAKAG